MQTIVLKSKKSCEEQFNHFELSEDSFIEISKRSIPGEWVQIQKEKTYWLGYVNLSNERFPVKILEQLNKEIPISANEEKIAQQFLKIKLEKAISYRQKFSNLKNGCRLVYGASDALPGLIVDEYQDAVLVQINTAGIDRFRSFIKTSLGKLTEKDVYFLDNKTYRKEEGLPEHDTELPNKITVMENDIQYEVSFENMQKVGYYYDHRMCRKMLAGILNLYTGKLEKGLDLFCYAGSWGLTMLKGPVEEVEFVDQGNFSETIKNNISKNKINKKNVFSRSDVFKFLETARKKSYDIIVCDPPAFSKSRQTQDNALVGYKKLYKMILPLLKENSFLVVASCTKNVTFQDLDQIVNTEAKKHALKPLLLDLGLQGFDHKISSLKDKGNYIKCLIYYFEK